MSLNANQLQQIRLGLLQFRRSLAETDDELQIRRMVADDSETLALIATLRTMNGALDDLAQTMQSALGFQVTADAVLQSVHYSTADELLSFCKENDIPGEALNTFRRPASDEYRLAITWEGTVYSANCHSDRLVEFGIQPAGEEVGASV